MPYQLPPWLTPRGDPASAFVSAVHTGAAIAQENTRLTQAAQAHNAAMQMEQQRMEANAAAESERLQAQNARASQELEMTKQYHDAELAIRQTALKQAAEKNQQQAASAATRMAAQQTYQQRVAAGEDATKVALELGPGMAGGSTASIAPLAKQFEASKRPPFVPSAQTVGDANLVEVSPGKWQQIVHEKKVSSFPPESRVRATALRDDIKDLRGQIGNEPPNTEEFKRSHAVWQKQVDELRSKQAEFDALTKPAQPPGPGAQAFIPNGITAGTATNAPVTRTGPVITHIRRSGEDWKALPGTKSMETPHGEEEAPTDLTTPMPMQTSRIQANDLGLQAPAPAAPRAPYVPPTYTLKPPRDYAAEGAAQNAQTRRFLTAVKDKVLNPLGSAGGGQGPPMKAPYYAKNRIEGELYDVDGEIKRWTKDGWESEETD
jgi:hypothetical protein